MGTGSAGYGLEDHLVYAMVVAETPDFQSYWLDPRFRSKRPNLKGSLKQLYGDNIYHQDGDGEWHQADSRHSRPDGVHEENMRQDLSANRVLVSTEFYYWGGSALPLPEAFRGSSGICKVGPGYRRNHPPGIADAFLSWLRGEVQSTGVLGAPFEFRRHVPVRQLQLPLHLR